jgi:hypothetical protein
MAAAIRLPLVIRSLKEHCCLDSFIDEKKVAVSAGAVPQANRMVDRFGPAASPAATAYAVQPPQSQLPPNGRG